MQLGKFVNLKKLKKMKNYRKIELFCIFFLLFTAFIYAQADSLAVNTVINQGLPVVGTVLSSFSPLAGQIFGLCIPLIILVIGYLQKKKYKANVAATVQPVIDAHAIGGGVQSNKDINALRTLIN